MQYTAYSIANLWKEGVREFYLYELTKTNKVLKHKIRELVEFDDCVVMAIGNDKTAPKHRLLFSQGGSTKKILGDSTYYTDFNSIKSKFHLKVGLDELEREILDLERDEKAIADLLRSKRNKLERLINGSEDPIFKELEDEDKKNKDSVTEFLQKTIYHYASRYGTDPSFTFFMNRLWERSDKSMEVEEFAKQYDNVPNEELNSLLTNKVQTVGT